MSSGFTYNQELWMRARPEVYFLCFHYVFLVQSKPNTMKEVNFDPSVDLSTWNKMRKRYELFLKQQGFNFIEGY